MMIDTGDLRVDTIMPELCDKWDVLTFEKCLLKTSKVNKVKVANLLEIGNTPVVDQGETYISGYINEQSLGYAGDLPVILFGDHTRKIKYIDFRFVVGADGCKIFKPNKNILERFFYHYLLSLNIQSQGYSRHYKFIKQIDVPIPPIDEQKRIVERLEILLGKINKANERLEKIPTILKRFRQSVLSSACSGRLTADWREENECGE